MRERYKTDLTDEQRANARELIPPARPGGRPRAVDVREVLNTRLYHARTGRPRGMLPQHPLPKSTVWDYFTALARRRHLGPGRRRPPGEVPRGRRPRADSAG